MTIDTTRDTADTAVDLRPGPEILPQHNPSGVWRDTPEQILSGTVLPAHSPFVHGVHPAYASLPLHVAALIDHHDLPRPHPAAIEIIRRYHLTPALGACAFSALGWWANLEPDHIWLMIPFLAFGILGPVGGWVGHLLHGADADTHITRGLIICGAVGMAGAAAVGAGFSGISAMTTALMVAVGTLGSIQWRARRRQADRDFVVDYHTAVASAPMPPAPVGTPPPAPQQAPGLMSDEAMRLHTAFAAIGVQPIQVDAIRRIGPEAWLTYIYLPESKSSSFRWLNTRLDTLRNNLRCRSVQIIPTAIGNRYEIRIQDGETSPLDESVEWPGANTDDITQPINIGVDEAGKPISIRLKGRHTLYAGITDGGKSVGVNVAVSTVAGMRNAVLVLMDLKPGQLELGPYEPVAMYSAAGPEDAALLLEALCAAMETRGEILKEERETTGRPVREWDPNRHGPDIVVVIDELAELLRLDPALFKQWVTLMQVSRALGIDVVGATQSPSSKALGGTTDGSGQFTNINCYRTKSATQTNVIHGPGAHGEGWRADETTLPLPGMFRPRSPEYPRPTIGRGYLITAEQVMANVAANADSRPELDRRTADAMEQVLGGRCNPQRPDGPGTGRDGSGTSGPKLRDVSSNVVPMYPDKTPVEEAHREAWDLFRHLNSATVRELMAHRLPGLGSRETCMTVLNVFKNHGGATSERDADGRSERFVCTVPPARRSREA